MFKYFLKRATKTKIKSLSYIDRKTAIWKPLIFLLPSLTLLIIMMIWPFITSADRAFSVQENQHKVGSTFYGMDNFKKVIDDIYFKKALSNSMLYAILVVPISLIISLIISVSIVNVLNRKVRSGAQTLFFMPYVTSIIAISMAFMFLFSTSGIVNKVFNIKTTWLTNTNANSHSAFIIILFQGVWSSLAFQILILTTAIMGVDKDRYKSASIDGAGPIKQFFRITLPSIKNTINFLVTVGLIGAIKVFPLALFDNSASKAQTFGGSTLMIFIYNNVVADGGTPNYEVAAAAALLLVAIAIAFNVFVKNILRLVEFIFNKIGDWRVKNKIKIWHK